MKKIKDAINLIISKGYILITHKQTVFAGNLTKLDKFTAIHTMRSIEKNIKDVIKKIEKEI